MEIERQWMFQSLIVWRCFGSLQKSHRLVGIRYGRKSGSENNESVMFRKLFIGVLQNEELQVDYWIFRHGFVER